MRLAALLHTVLYFPLYFIDPFASDDGPLTFCVADL